MIMGFFDMFEYFIGRFFLFLFRYMFMTCHCDEDFAEGEVLVKT